MADHLFREFSGKMTAILCRVFGLHRLEEIADVVQDSFESALQQWRFKGIPDNPEGWLVQVARNKMINCVKRDGRSREIMSSFAEQVDERVYTEEFDFQASPGQVVDSQLRLLLLCGQVNLNQKARVVLTLHILCGFGKTEIAKALLSNEEAVKKTLFRAKSALKSQANIIGSPALLQSEDAVATAISVLYLMFNEGYKTTASKKPIDLDLCYEALRLVNLLLDARVLLHQDTRALCALMYFTLARSEARFSEEGLLVSIKNQDRRLWDQSLIQEGYYQLRQAIKGERLSRFHLEALIASIHCAAETFQNTNFQQISFLYRELEKLMPSPLVSVNRLLAESYSEPDYTKQLQELDNLQLLLTETDLNLYFAARADLLERACDPAGAATALTQAYVLSKGAADRRFFLSKIHHLKMTLP